jgi:hypothetical protein
MNKVILLLCAALFCLKLAVGQTCGYESCPATKAGMINVHLVPHTHDDVGWLKTVDQYYYGSRKVIESLNKEVFSKPLPHLQSFSTILLCSRREFNAEGCLARNVSLYLSTVNHIGLFSINKNDLSSEFLIISI